MFVDLVPGHQVGDRIAALFKAVATVIGQSDVVVHAALPVNVAAHAQVLQRTLEAIDGGHLEQMLRRVGFETLIVVGRVFVLDVVRAGIGIASADLPVVGQRALQFHVHALAAYLAR
ncbi:hypothetical protein D3C81_1462690 [compost metagenome]